MAQIIKYTKKGESLYRFKLYLGIDPVTGKRVETSRRGFKRKKDAERVIRQLQLDFANGNYGKAKDTNIKTFDDLFNLWFESYENTVKPNTAETKKIRYERVVKPLIGNANIKKITPALAQQIVNKLAAKYKSYRQYLVILNSPLNYAVKLSMLDVNVFKLVIFPKATDKKKYKHIESDNNFYSKDELITFLENVKGYNFKYYTFFRLLAYSGMRSGECLALQWKDIDFNDQTITITKTTAYNPGKKETTINTPKTKKSKRVISIDDVTLSVLKKWRLQQQKRLLKFGFNTNNSQQFLFTNPETNKYYPSHVATSWLGTVYRNFPDMKKITAHGFRHTHASLLFESGANIKEVQERLGHSTSKMTLDIYTHVTQNRKQETSLKFANFMQN